MCSLQLHLCRHNLSAALEAMQQVVANTLELMALKGDIAKADAPRDATEVRCATVFFAAVSISCMCQYSLIHFFVTNKLKLTNFSPSSSP
jgi:hypothetical protein